MSEEMNALQGVAEAEPVAPTVEGTEVQQPVTETTEPNGAENAENGEKTAEPTAKKPADWAHKRIDKLTKEKYDNARRAEQAEAQLKEVLDKLGRGETHEAPVKAPENLTEAQIDARADQKLAIKAFNEACDRAYHSGKAEFNDFDDAIKTLGSVGALGQDPQAIKFLSAVTELDAPHKVLHYLGSNPEEAERVLNMSSAKQAIELARLETKVAKPATVQVSQAPPPIKPAVGVAKPAIDPYDPNISQADFEKWRNENRKSKW